MLSRTHPAEWTGWFRTPCTRRFSILRGREPRPICCSTTDSWERGRRDRKVRELATQDSLTASHQRGSYLYRIPRVTSALGYVFVLGSRFARHSVVDMAIVKYVLPAPCQRCDHVEGVPFKVETMANGNVCVTVRCRSCAHEWELEIDGENVALGPKRDRRDYRTRNPDNRHAGSQTERTGPDRPGLAERET